MIETLFPYVYILLRGFISFLSQFESLLGAKIDLLALSKVFLFCLILPHVLGKMRQLIDISIVLFMAYYEIIF